MARFRLRCAGSRALCVSHALLPEISEDREALSLTRRFLEAQFKASLSSSASLKGKQELYRELVGATA